MVTKTPIEDLEKSDLVALMLNYSANNINCQVAASDDDFNNCSEFKTATIVDIAKDIHENNYFIADDGATYSAARAINDDGSFVTYRQWIKDIHAFISQ